MNAADAAYQLGFHPEVNTALRQLNAKGLPYNDLLNQAIEKHVPQDAQEITKAIAKRVVKFLMAKLDEAAGKPGTTFFGRLWRSLWGKKKPVAGCDDNSCTIPNT